MTVLDIRNLRTSLHIGGRWHDALREISFVVEQGETVAIVGESGCGKSMLAMSILGLLPAGIGQVTEGEIHLDGTRTDKLPRKDMEKILGGKIGMIFQDPMSSLNPVLTVGEQIAEPIRDHTGLTKRNAMREAVGLMERVRIPSAAARVHNYPHQFSGGMRQRVMIATAIACNPRLLIADEPTTALDVTVQRQILDLLLALQSEQSMGLMLITHNLGLVAGYAKRVIVLYGGDMVEEASVGDLFDRPLHPYTQALLHALPRVDRDSDRLESIPGQVPSLPKMPDGCRFANRCPHRMPKCERLPPLVRHDGHAVRCWLHVQEAAA